MGDRGPDGPCIISFPNLQKPKELRTIAELLNGAADYIDECALKERKAFDRSEAERKMLLQRNIEWREKYNKLHEDYMAIGNRLAEYETGKKGTIWKDAKKDPPKNMGEVVIWSETGLDIGYYTEKFGWIRKDGIPLEVKYWSQLSEPVVFKTPKGE